MTHIERLNALLTQVDLLNQQDPNKVDTQAHGQVGKEWLYSQRMQACLTEFAPDANETLKIAAYCQHIQRWAIPRSDYPMDRSGYKRWRTELGKFHGDTTAKLMQQQGYSEEDIERVKYLLQKKGLKRDSDTQALEDVICLVFLSYYLEDFVIKHSEEKIFDIIRKTWKKMSDKGHKAALALPLPQHLLNLVSKALEA